MVGFSDSFEMTNRRVRVLVPRKVPRCYDYLAPDGLCLGPGDIVRVSLGAGEISGVVWSVPDAGSEGFDPDKLKTVIRRHEVPPLPEPMMRFVDWLAAYTMTAPGLVLRMVLRVPRALEPFTAKTAYVTADDWPGKMTAARQRVQAFVSDGLMHFKPEIMAEAGVSASVINGLAAGGGLREVAAPAVDFPRPDPDHPGPALSAEQAQAAAMLCQAAASGESPVSLLDGVTGSGKTQVYFEAAAAALRAGRQVLILVPEIGLTVQFLERFEARFGCQPAVWHSDITQAQRRDVWRGVATGKITALVGARSALFLPFPDLGLIVADEEHDQAYKQEDGVCYHARDMAVVRGMLGGFPVILSSATPSLESLVNAEKGRYRHVRLTRRYGVAGLPDIEAIDMRTHPPERGNWLSPVLVEAMAQTLARKEQVLLFLNRRGYAPLTLCRKCGHRLQCPHCDAWLVAHWGVAHRRVSHQGGHKLLCHHCGHSLRQPERCPACENEGCLVACGPGVERIAEEVAAVFAQARRLVLSSDHLSSSAAAQAVINDIAAHKYDIVIGTQIVAKGHHFPLLSLVGVIDADLGLGNGDMRASERTYQLLHQVGGRAGRAEHRGRVLLQSYQPENPVMQALIKGDRNSFVARECHLREILGLPPFGRLAALILSGPERGAVIRFAGQVARARPTDAEIEVLGPAPAPITLLRGRVRYRFLIKAPKVKDIQGFISHWLKAVKAPAGVRIKIDIDPYNFI